MKTICQKCGAVWNVKEWTSCPTCMRKRFNDKDDYTHFPNKKTIYTMSLGIKPLDTTDAINITNKK